jgi:hypothetical protein
MQGLLILYLMLFALAGSLEKSMPAKDKFAVKITHAVSQSIFAKRYSMKATL